MKTYLFERAVPYRGQMIVPFKMQNGFNFITIDQGFSPSIPDDSKSYPTVEEAITAGKRWVDDILQQMQRNFPDDYAMFYGSQRNLPGMVDTVDRLKHQLLLIQLATEHPDKEEAFIVDEISHGLDIALSEVKAIEALLKNDK